MPRRKKPQGRPPALMPTIPDTFENILKTVVRPKPQSEGGYIRETKANYDPKGSSS